MYSAIGLIAVLYFKIMVFAKNSSSVHNTLMSDDTAIKTRIYLDYAGSTPVLPEAIRAYEVASQEYGNPGAIHTEGVEAHVSLTRARESVARQLGCKPREIIFTSGGTEGNNLAILGFARKQLLLRGTLAHTHWIVSAIEHPSVLEAYGEVERLGGEVTFAPCDAHGVIMPEEIERLLRKETVFVSIGWGNGEIGTIQPLARIARVIAAHGKVYGTTILLHSDAGQAPLYEAAHPRSLGVDLLSLDSGKLYGPRGIGALYMSDRADISGVTFGGSQERGLRAGTENVALAAGFAKAFDIIALERVDEGRRLRELRNDFAREIAALIPAVVFNTDLRNSLPHILNISVPNINSEYVVLALDHAGFALSTKSACREGEARESHVVKALAVAAEALAKEAGLHWRATSTLRFSFGRATTVLDLSLAAQALAKACTLAADFGHV